MAIEQAEVTRHFIAAPQGTLHYAQAGHAQAGQGEPILLLHQTPRSWDEFREVLPLLVSAGARSRWTRSASVTPRRRPAVARYDLEAVLSQIRCPVLLIGATQDPAAYPALARLRAALPQAQVEEIEGGMVPLPDQLPVPFAAAVARFLDGL